MKLRRVVLLAIVVLASITLGSTWSRGATASGPAGRPIFQFINSGTGPLPWNAHSLESSINHTTMLGGPHAVSNATEGVLAYRTNRNHLALYTQSLTAHDWTDFSTPANSLPAPSADPLPFFDPSGNVDLLYIDTDAHLILLSRNDPITRLWHNLRLRSAWRPYVATDLSTLSGVTAANGLASILVNGLSANIAFRTSVNNIEVLQLGWASAHPVPFLTSSPGTVVVNAVKAPPPVTTTTKPATTTTKPVTTTTKAATTTTTLKPGGTTTTTKPVTTTTKVTTTTIPPSSVAVASDPIVLPGVTATFATTTNQGDVLIFTNTGATLGGWSYLDVTKLTLAPKVAGTLAMTYNTSTADVASLTSTGHVELFSTPVSASNPAIQGHVAIVSPPRWSALDVTSGALGAPPLSGSLFLSATATQLTIDGQAANWGDLFAITNTPGLATWTATDVSVTAGSSARTVGGVVTGIQLGTTLTLYAAGVSAPPPQGVGVYAIPSSKWSKAISDGWPIVSETGALGTQSAPWVGFTSTGSVASSPDFFMGQSIYNSHKRVTWLSFWTASGPMKSEVQTPSAYYDHGYAAGRWVATQIDQYRSLGVGLKPDWVIFDPEGYPDNHSGLDAPGGSSAATIAKYATYWSSMLKGWSDGIASVDPQLNAGVYASQSEYRNYKLATESMPVFVAVAFGGGGPLPVAGASGSNIRGFISFSATCTPEATLRAEEATLLNPPWSGQFNTLQFNAGVYCPPSTP